MAAEHGAMSGRRLQHVRRMLKALVNAARGPGGGLMPAADQRLLRVDNVRDLACPGSVRSGRIPDMTGRSD
jgi:hypothetical protein